MLSWVIVPRQLPCALILLAAITAAPTVSMAQSPTLAAAVLPSSRSVQVGATATVFATILTSGATAATGCTIAMPPGLPASFLFQRTNPTTNAMVGSPNTPVDIPANGKQTFLIAVTPTGPFNPADMLLVFDCSNTTPAPMISGVSTLLLSASDTSVPDIVMLSATITRDGIANIPGANGNVAFAVATVNVGASGNITISADTGSVGLPVKLTVCQTDPSTGSCLSTPQSSQSLAINSGGTPTFAIFVNGSGNVPFDPATNRIFVRAKDSGGGTTRGSTSVAAATGPEPVDPLRAKTELLIGHWHFAYTIISTFTDEYTLTTIDGSTNSQGGYFINGTDQYGGIVVASYFPNEKVWALLDPSIIIDKFYYFYTDGATILQNSCYYQIYPAGSTNFSRCYALVGRNTGPAATSQLSRSADEDTLEQEARMMENEEVSRGRSGNATVNPDILEKYLLLREMIR